MTKRMLHPLLSLRSSVLREELAGQAHVDRANQTLKHEVMIHFVTVWERRLNPICPEARQWHDTERGRSARANVPPAWQSPPADDPALGGGVCDGRLNHQE
mgnify:FL=1